MKIAQELQELYEKDQYLLADSAYASSPWVVPAQNEDNCSFNYCIEKSRVRIKHAIGISKEGWFSLREMRNQMGDDCEIEYFVSWVVSFMILNTMSAQIGDEWFDLYEYDDPPHAENLANHDIGEDVVDMHEKIKPIAWAWKNSQL
ncbi:hypothetical protein O181_097380 [Austropuccinia psidii MF-1]|uniref:DDE Tnp4 domain-containing protein n=1 Tax=Austropuccinia psidii MF-1 TaxID=1389203 RepID=A0A9Q3J9H5_9BASI|nr:hypothetical protein [Austropuccinia psidii MF-1]